MMQFWNINLSIQENSLFCKIGELYNKLLYKIENVNLSIKKRRGEL